MDALVADAADDRPLLDFKHDNLAAGLAGRVLDLEFHFLEKLGIPEGLKIAAQRVLVIGVAGPAEDAGLQGVLADSPVAFEIDALDERLSRSLVRTRLLRGGNAFFDFFFEG